MRRYHVRTLAPNAPEPWEFDTLDAALAFLAEVAREQAADDADIALVIEPVHALTSTGRSQ